jgi:hypothetical protein
MTRETVVWTVLFVAGGLFLVYRAAFTEHGMGKVYVKPAEVESATEPPAGVRYVETSPKDPAAVVSYPRTIGLWIAALFTLAIFSFLYRDNVFYKLAESIFVGMSAAWVMVVAFWDVLVKRLMCELRPDAMRTWAVPELDSAKEPDYWYLVPLALGIMLLWRLAPRGGWIARWPLAFVVGTYAGLRLVNFLDADFVNQIRNTVIPLVVLTAERQVDVWASVRNIGLVVGVLACLTYFFFSLEHRGFVGRVSRVGIWFLMITFGASFAFTVMGRIALLASRLEFLFDDWLWLIDPTNKRPPGW